MSDKHQRIQEIINQTRAAFLLDADGKMTDIRSRLEEWRSGGISLELFIEILYKHVHGLKGLALTLSYSTIHQLCEEHIALISQHDEAVWTQERLQSLHMLTGRLETELGHLQQQQS